MSLQADRPVRERRCWWLAAVVALAVGGCGRTSDALSGAACASGATTQLSRQLMRSWCPQAVADGGRRLTEAQARDACIGRGMRGCASCVANGYHPTRVRR